MAQADLAESSWCIAGFQSFSSRTVAGVDEEYHQE